MSPRRENLPNFDEKNPTVVSPKSIAIPLWFSWSITVFSVTMTIWILSQFNALRSELNAMSSKLDTVLKDRWTKGDARESFYELREKNRKLDLTTPDVDEISNRIDGR